jgi:5-methylcytosine-specific restriction endonuclease McrA
MQYKMQCNECGHVTSNPIQHDRVRGLQIEAWDETIEHSRAQRRAAALNDERREWFANYDQYLRSPEWRARRALVMRRAGGTCEGCGTARANQVHHLTYAHVQREFLWELVAVCAACHERLHAEKEGGQG